MKLNVTQERWIGMGAGLLVLFLISGRLWWLPAHASLNVNEGWNAMQALRAIGTGALYPDPEALTANNYPPLSFYIVGAAGWLLGDAIVAGRMIALLALIGNAAAIHMIVRRLVPNARWAWAGVVMFALMSVTILRNYLVTNDSQWLGQAMMSSALVLLVARRAGASFATRALVAAAALMVAGGLIKHNLVAFPLAATLWLWLTDRRAATIWLISGAVFALAACAALFALWGATIFIDVLAPARGYSLARMVAKGGPLLLFALPGVLAARPLLARRDEDRGFLLCAMLTAIAIPLGIVQRAGSGVDVNAFFETMIALSIAVPAGCALRREMPARWLALAMLPALCLVPDAAIRSVGELLKRDDAVRQARPFIARIAAAPGPVACDDQAICYWAGRESALDFFSVKQRLLQHEGVALAPALAARHFAMIQMRSDNPGWQENLLIPAIRARYRPIYAAGGSELLVPKR